MRHLLTSRRQYGYRALILKKSLSLNFLCLSYACILFKEWLTSCIRKRGDECFDFINVELVHEFLHHVFLPFLVNDSDINIREGAVKPETQKQVLKGKVRIVLTSLPVNYYCRNQHWKSTVCFQFIFSGYFFTKINGIANKISISINYYIGENCQTEKKIPLDS